MDAFDYSGNPERPIHVRVTIQAEGNKLRWIKPLSAQADRDACRSSAWGCVAFLARGAAAISGQSAEP